MIPLARFAVQTKKFVLTLWPSWRRSDDSLPGPPNPGPLVVAGELEVDLGRMIVGGLLVGLVGMSGAFAYARWFNARHPIEMRSEQTKGPTASPSWRRPPTDLPGLLASLAPILIPVLLIAGKSVLVQLVQGEENGNLLFDCLMVLGDKNLALTLGALLALRQLMRSKVIAKPDLGQTVKDSLQRPA